MAARVLLGVLAVFLLSASACRPLIVFTSDDTGPRKLEIDEAESRCDDGDACACDAVGFFRKRDGDASAARASFIRACSLHCALGCANLGDTYFDAHDVALGTRYAIRACKLDASHCSPAGQRFENGNGVPKDMARARLFYREGCARKDTDACTRADLLKERR